MKKKTLALLLSLVLVFGVIAGGTLAWLTAKSDTVTNTFTTSDIKVELKETGTTNNKNSYKMIPGYTITKDPTAKVLAGSEECYLFVKLEKSANFDDFMTYTIAEGWTQLTTDKDGKAITDLIYYREVLTANMDTAYSVLANDQVTVKSSVTKANMNALTAQTYPTLTVTAYASQLHKNATENFTAAEAWSNAQPTVAP